TIAPCATLANPPDTSPSGEKAGAPATPAPVERNLDKEGVLARVEGTVPEPCRRLVGSPGKGSPSGLLSWGETGAVRVYVDECYLEPTEHRVVAGVRIINEGNLDF